MKLTCIKSISLVDSSHPINKAFSDHITSQTLLELVPLPNSMQSASCDQSQTHTKIQECSKINNIINNIIIFFYKRIFLTIDCICVYNIVISQDSGFLCYL